MSPSKGTEAASPQSRSNQWRRDRLLQMGVPSAIATVVAADERYDIHALLTLTDRGCDPELAVRIVAPLEEDPG